jgi:hypothetical protein
MTGDLATILAGTAAILAVVAVWLGGIVYVFWDVSRRNLAGWPGVIWRVLAFVPLLGLLVYLIFRRVIGSPAGASASVEVQPERVTFLKPPPPGAGKRLPTIPAAAYIHGSGQDHRKAGRAVDEPRRGSQRYTLTVLEGPHAGQEFVLDRLPARIGRDSGCAVRLDNDRGVSRRHAELYQGADGLRLRDLGSTHGTRINGQRVDEVGLKPGDKLQVGYSLLLLR